MRYLVQVVQIDRPDWLDQLRQGIAAELHAIGMHRSVVIDVAETTARPADSPTVAVILIGPASKSDVDLAVAIETIQASGTVAIPVLADLNIFHSQAPDQLSLLNGFEWSGPDPERRLARCLFEELGIEERERRVFISHKRSDGLGAAEQLHDVLSHARFEPFIDRFAIRPGEEVQTRIADALERHAFLLILETPEAHLSDWVFDEVDYALSHTMANLIVQWPGVTTQIPGSDGIPRMKLASTDLSTDAHGYDVLTEEALDRVLEAAEAAHANGLVRRRRMLIGSVDDAASAAGADCTPLRDWMLDVRAASGRAVISVAPRLPDAMDLQKVDEARGKADPGAAAVLVHATRQLRPELAEHLAWATGSRSLTLIPDNAVGTYW